MNYKDGETEFDLRQWQLETIGILTQEKTMAYRDALHDKRPDNLRRLLNELKTLYTQGLKRFVEKENNEQLINKIDELIQKLEANIDGDMVYDDKDDIFKDLEKLDEKVQKLQMKAGLDIPRKKEYDPENAGVAGLEG